jgi:alpha-tubulin suppressor-like RCC1 family protein
LYGQLDGVTEVETAVEPLAVAGLGGEASSIGAGWFHNCAFMETREVTCWGNNQVGQLGPRQTESSARLNPPAAVPGLPDDIVQLVVGGGHNCVLTSTGAVTCWGGNNYGQLGDGTTTDSATPIDVVGLPPEVTAIAAGTGHTCALTSSGAVWCWGHDWYGELGDGTSGEGNVQPRPVEMLGLAQPVTALALGRFHSCVIYDDGTAACAGRNGYGELGDGTRAQRLAPVAVLTEP